MIRLIILLLSITAISLGFAWIADEPGRATIDWGIYHIETSLLVMVAGAALFALACAVACWLLFMIMRTPRMWLRSQLARRQALGLEALTAAFAAIATQDIGTAKKQIGRAQQYLPHQPLTLMLSAQVARLEGNEPQARLYLEQMLKNEDTEFMAMRSLVETSRRTHDDTAAVIYAEKALALKPQDEWLITTLSALYTQANRTQDALRLLEQSTRRHYVSGKESRALSAYVLYENARSLASQNRWDFAIAVLEDALRKQPLFVPAATLLAEAYIKQSEGKRALKIIETVWKATPHPALAALALDFYDSDKERKKAVQTIEKMAARHMEHRESQFLLAGLALKRHDRVAARNYLQYHVRDSETVRACTLMAELEAMNENNEQAAQWLKRAGSALPDTAWTCSSCSHTFDVWHFTCSHCSAVASMVWE